ncbi:MAG: hypothetical protein ACPL7K_07205, partial [Armatimonadota bacterium]
DAPYLPQNLFTQRMVRYLGASYFHRSTCGAGAPGEVGHHLCAGYKTNKPLGKFDFEWVGDVEYDALIDLPLNCGVDRWVRVAEKDRTKCAEIVDRLATLVVPESTSLAAHSERGISRYVAGALVPLSTSHHYLARAFDEIGCVHILLNIRTVAIKRACRNSLSSPATLCCWS